MAAPIPMSIAVLVLSIISAGIYDVFTNYEQNGCEMTYMFEWPEYQKIQLGRIEKLFPDYGLSIYGEGAYAEENKKLRLQGIPVLFIPGNAGSHKQVRSLGSVALRMAQNDQMTNHQGTPGIKMADKKEGQTHFNYFVVDFDEELSALYGGILDKQTEFVHLCLKKILTFYADAKHPPTSVVLVGHSMGGMVARALFTRPDFDPKLVNTIITQATPHQRPVAPLDEHLEEFYTRVNAHWSSHAPSTLRHVTVVSTSGGYRDVQVRHATTMLDGIVAADRAISTSTMAVPKAWVSTDHLCAVWCRQMVVLTQRALFDLVDPGTSQVSDDPGHRMRVFTHHYIHNNGIPDYLGHQENQTLTLDPKAKWVTQEDKAWRFSTVRTKKMQYFAVPTNVEEKSNTVIVITNLTNPDWICYCDIPEGETMCATCTSLSSRSRLLPPLNSNTKYVEINFKTIDRNNDTHIVIIVPPKQEKVSISSDRYNSDERHLVYSMPNTYDSIISYPVSATDGAAMLRISNNSAFYSLHLSGLSLPTTAYRAVVTPMGCKRHNAEANEGSVLRLRVPWSEEDSYAYSGFGKEISIPVKLQSGRPGAYDWRDEHAEPHLEMFLHPYCHYRLRLVVATSDSLGQMVRFYGVLLPGSLVAVLMMMLRGLVVGQGRGHGVSIKEQTPADCLMEHCKPYYLLPTVMVYGFLINFGPIARMATKLGLPEVDATSLQADNIWFRLLPLGLYGTAWMLAYVQSVVVFYMMIVIAALGRCFSRLPLSTLTSKGQPVLCVVAVAASVLCGSLGVCVVTALLIMKVLGLMYTVSIKQDTKATHRRLGTCFTVMMMVSLQALVGMGPLVIWAKGLGRSSSWLPVLEGDPSRWTGMVTVVAVLGLVWAEDAVVTRSHSTVVGYLLYGLAALSLVYGTRSLYRLPTFTSLAALTTAVPHVASHLALLYGQRRKDE